MVQVPVLQTFTHEGRRLKVGDRVALSPVTAAIYARKGWVSLNRTYHTADLTPARADLTPGENAHHAAAESIREPEQADGESARKSRTPATTNSRRSRRTTDSDEAATER